MSNLIDRDALVGQYRKECMGGCGNCDHWKYEMGGCDLIFCAPAVDAPTIVRCGKCIHRRKPLYPHPSLVWCPVIEHHRSPDWFCADGKKEEK